MFGGEYGITIRISVAAAVGEAREARAGARVGAQVGAPVGAGAGARGARGAGRTTRTCSVRPHSSPRHTRWRVCRPAATPRPSDPGSAPALPRPRLGPSSAPARPRPDSGSGVVVGAHDDSHDAHTDIARFYTYYFLLFSRSFSSCVAPDFIEFVSRFQVNMIIY